MENYSSFAAVPVRHGRSEVAPHIRVLQTVTAILFILKLLWELFGSSLLFRAGQSFATVNSTMVTVMYVSYALWIIPFIIASNKQIRMAVLFFVLIGFIINFIMMLCGMADWSPSVIAVVVILTYALAVSYIFSILARNAGPDNPVNKWLVIWLTISIVGYVVNLFTPHLLAESGISPTKFYGNSPVSSFNLVVSVFMIIAYWQVFRSSLFNGYKSIDSSVSLLPSVNSWVLKGVLMAAFSIGIICIWFETMGKSLV